PCQMMIDTGANATIIHPDVLYDLSIPPRQPFQPQECLSSDCDWRLCTQAHGKVELQFRIGTIRVKHPAYIADIHDDCILGLDYLREHDFVVDLQENLLHCDGEAVPPCSRERARCHVKSVSVILKEDAVTPSRSEAIIPGALSKTHELCSWRSASLLHRNHSKRAYLLPELL
ncbi:retroviral-like aspartic protease family protein, partial [Salmonella enterica subsp. enterica serovar Derby]|nr:retroviral-like aspartic protease family protein [Salmonella enterica subsp. enterica serovar Derby]